MERDSLKMRGTGRFVFAQINAGLGLDQIEEHVLGAMRDGSKKKENANPALQARAARVIMRVSRGNT